MFALWFDISLKIKSIFYVVVIYANCETDLLLFHIIYLPKITRVKNKNVGVQINSRIPDSRYDAAVSNPREKHLVEL